MSNKIWVLQKEQKGVGYESCTHIETEMFWFEKPSIEALEKTGFLNESATELYHAGCSERRFHRWNLIQITEGESLL